MSSVRTRLARYPIPCPLRDKMIDRNDLICVVTRGAIETSACYSCAFDEWDASRGEEDKS